jgi:hypothetical protein
LLIRRSPCLLLTKERIRLVQQMTDPGPTDAKDVGDVAVGQADHVKRFCLPPALGYGGQKAECFPERESFPVWVSRIRWLDEELTVLLIHGQRRMTGLLGMQSPRFPFRRHNEPRTPTTVTIRLVAHENGPCECARVFNDVRRSVDSVLDDPRQNRIELLEQFRLIAMWLWPP